MSHRMKMRCILVADGVRARFFSHDPTSVGPHRSALTELAALADPAAEKSGTSGGDGRSESLGPGHIRALDEQRARHDVETEKRFATQVAHEAGLRIRELSAAELIVVADPRMLGVLRPALEKVVHTQQVEMKSLARELSKLAAKEIEEHLRHGGLLPEPTAEVTSPPRHGHPS